MFIIAWLVVGLIVNVAWIAIGWTVHKKRGNSFVGLNKEEKDVKEYANKLASKVGFWTSMAFGWLINIILWPVTLWCTVSLRRSFDSKEIES